MKKITTWLNNLSISYKVFAISFIAVVSFIIFLAYQSYSTSQINGMLVEIETVDQPVLKLLDENFLSFISARTNLIAASAEQDMEGIDTAKLEIAKIESGLGEIKRIQPEHRLQADELIIKSGTYLDIGIKLAEGLNNEEMEFSTIMALTEELKLAEKAYLEGQKVFRSERESAFNEKLQKSREKGSSAASTGVVIALVISGFLIAITLLFVRMIRTALSNAISVAEKIAEGDRDSVVNIVSQDETGQLLGAINKMRESLKTKESEEEANNKEQSDIAGLNDTLRGEHDITELGQRVLNYLTPVLEAQVSALYLVNDQELKMVSSYAFTRRKNFSSTFEFGESLVGQAALEQKQIVVTDIPENYIAVSSALGNSSPKNISVTPIINDGALEAILEVGSVNEFNDKQLQFLENISSSVAIAINSTQSRNKLSEILSVTQEQAKALQESEAELQNQQEELRVSNEELEDQAGKLRASEEHLQNQQEELRVINEELEEQTKALELQKSDLEKNNLQLEESRVELEEKSKDLEKSSQYKSEFLSTMSHELRTPLNSILILSKMLSGNKTENLSTKQVEHVEVIHSAGSDLLELINDILDLSKIEEGKLDFVVDQINLNDWVENLHKNFSHVVADKKLDFKIELDPQLPAHMLSDGHRIDQVVKNMISNALKFTEHGGITIKLAPPTPSAQFTELGLNAKDCISFSVIDTGIGIPKDKQAMIFEAFQQADGTTSRKFGGTGLGLTISRQLSIFLGGDLIVSSEGEGLGTTFSLTIPLKAAQASELPADVLAELEERSDHEHAKAARLDAVRTEVTGVISQASETASVLKDTLMIVEDDEDFANTLSALAQDYGLNTLRAEDGETALEILEKKHPSAIILDVGLPGIDGWEVMDRIKENPKTCDIPVHFISGHNSEEKALEMGAMGFLMKPVSAEQLSTAFSKIEEETMSGVKKLLVIEDNEVEILSIKQMFNDKDISMTTVSTGEDALQKLAQERFDCMIMDLDLPDINGLTLLETLNESDDFEPIPVIVYTAKDLEREEEALLRRYASRIILKAGQSSERLLSEVSLFLHWLESNGDESSKPVASSDGRDDIFLNKRILVVDDDMRNIYSLSAVLEGVGLECVLASNGIECLESLEEDANVDAILMDIMMPEMDGYETMQKIREQAKFVDMPIIALTAKAMKEDKQKCIDAGANDYLSKPLDTDKVLALLRVWLSQSEQKVTA